jgi:hypothetical protein
MRPPAKPFEADGSWSQVERTLGTSLPDDYKDFIRIYGSGRIGHFMGVLNPFAKNPNMNLLEKSRELLDTLRYLRDDGEPIPYAIYPTSGGLFPVAVTDNGDVINWLTNGGAADWTIVVNESRGPDYEQFDCNLTAFLQGLLDQSLICEILPTFDFDGAAEFTPHS